MAFDSKWAHDEDRTYHGMQGDDGVRRIFVEKTTHGLTERSSATVLRELPPDPVITFHWGYTGSGPNQTANAILIDALGWEPAMQLRHAFVWDWVGVTAGEFRFRRSAIIRWARGFYCDRGMHNLRAPLDELPPLDPGHYAISPELRAKLEPRDP